MKRVTSVQFRGVDYAAKFKSISRGVYAPQPARVEWSDGSIDEGDLRPLSFGASRDVFVLEKGEYVLKVQQEQWEAKSNGVEYDLSKTVLKELMQAMYGCAA